MNVTYTTPAAPAVAIIDMPVNSVFRMGTSKRTFVRLMDGYGELHTATSGSSVLANGGISVIAYAFEFYGPAYRKASYDPCMQRGTVIGTLNFSA